MAKILIANGKTVKSNDQPKKKQKFTFMTGNKSSINKVEIYAYSEKQARYLLIERAKQYNIYFPYIELVENSILETKEQKINRLLKEYDEYDQAFCECISNSDIKSNYADKMHEIDKELKALGYIDDN